MSVFPEVQGFSRSQQALGLATPQSSPLLADQEDFGAEADEQETFQEYEEHEAEDAEVSVLAAST